ncbi:transketolase subunit A [Nocardiopsis sp. Huas11]|uniref:transketolase n=1 Tax=Nocardiopsis sp. Huas11 TaxID=2183912 RepID=UPI000EABEF05|nr:transketolase [Nocardiopsis sp. Huas11]RKS08414.1 transketolase subunit A [Nocardiopsis sp. Huas11]
MTDGIPPDHRATDLSRVVERVRSGIVRMCSSPEGGHLGSSLSIADILTALYFRILRVSPDAPEAPDRDIFILSKGHGAVALYSVLAARGFFPARELDTFGRPGTRLMAHPVRAVPGVEFATGSLGHGLAVALGFALAAARSDGDRRTFVLLGDGELQEGSVWEAAAVAAAQGADGLTSIVDCNSLQLNGATGPLQSEASLADRWRSFGWSVRHVDGHDVHAVASQLDVTPWEPGRPSVLLARTVKGNGVPFAEGKVRSHYARLSPRQRDRALAALSRHGTRGAGDG